MKGDFTRNTFDPKKHFLRVLMQQGRVQLDADFNEQTSILLHYMHTFISDVFGSHFTVPVAGEIDKWGFEITGYSETTMTIGSGHYYVNGLLCENESELQYNEQEAYPISKEGFPALENPYLVYLDVWERDISCDQDKDIRDVALGEADTATRSKLMWQVKVETISDIKDQMAEKGITDNLGNVNDISINEIIDNWQYVCRVWESNNRGLFKAQAKKPKNEDTLDPCLISSKAQYRGTENQLYRVEIHNSGTADNATFKWSRDNGSIVFPIRTLDGTMAKLEHLGRDRSRSLEIGDWVEITDDNIVLRGQPGYLVQITEVNPVDLQVTFTVPKDCSAPQGYKDEAKDRANHPILRRWDQETSKVTDLQCGAIPLKMKENKWISLKDGIEVCFTSAETEGTKHYYRTGDYWLIPARIATGDIEWPKDGKLPPDGVHHHYAPLGLFVNDPNRIEDCRCKITPPACNYA